jgi:predicted negative regulator of RcsB-dependent stress response
MAEEEPKRTRRAQRRAAKPEVQEPDEPVDESELAPRTGPSERKQKKAPSAEEIRDRNRRLREEAAARRRKKRDSEQAATATGLDAGEMVDDALARSTHAVTGWLRRHFNVVQWVIVLGVAGAIGWQIYSWRSAKQAEKASDKLMAAVEAEQGTIAGAAPARDEEGAAERPSFPTEQARLAAAERAYREASETRAGSTTSLLARLGLAGVLYDQGKHELARQEYEAVKNSPLAAKDPDVRGRALEGLGLSLEGKGQLDAALKAFRELENFGALGFDALGQYHQARVHFAKKEQDKAKQLAQKLIEKLEKATSANWRATYLTRAARELLHTIDPSTAPSGPPGLSPEAIEQLKQQMLQDPDKMQKLLEDMAGSTKALTGQGVPGLPPASPPPAPLTASPPASPPEKQNP